MAEEAGSLSFRYAGLSRLPDSIAQTRGVRRFDRVGQSREAVVLESQSLGDLPLLEKLDLRWNKLTVTPASLARLEQRGCTVLR